MSLTLNQKLYGTTQKPQAYRQITVGPLSLRLEAGNIRYIHFHGVEVLRAVSFLVRDTAWGTYAPEFRQLKIKHKTKSFVVSYTAICAGNEGRFEYYAKIEGSTSGQVLFSASGSSSKDFPTNRVGFVVLHPLQGVVGKKLLLEHTDGKKSKLLMPKIIAAEQPAFDLRAITHSPVAGLKIRAEMQGDAYEMEDQRNWSDASFKTYVRPLSRPRPFMIPANDLIEQCVKINITGRPKSKFAQNMKNKLDIKSSSAKFPTCSLGLDIEDAKPTVEHAKILLQLGVAHVVVRFDTAKHNTAHLHDIALCLAALHANAHFEVVIPGLNPEQELLEFKSALRANDIRPVSIVVRPQRDLKTRPSHHVPNGEASATEIAQITRKLFPNAKIGGGTFSLFTEFNRNPPPAEYIDFITHASCSIVHAADDVSVMETLETFDDIAISVRQLAPKKPYHISPSAIGMRHNPYGASTAANPLRQRLTLSRIDPRQAGLFAAAWAVGYLAAAARNKVDLVGVCHGLGDFGAIEASGTLRPIFHVLRGAAHASGKPVLAVTPASKSIAAFGVQVGHSQILWVANLTAEPQSVQFGRRAGIAQLDAKHFNQAARDPMFMDKISSQENSILLTSYSCARVTF